APLPGDLQDDELRRRLGTMLRHQTAAVDRICRLTPEQKQKLALFGRSDIERHRERPPGPDGTRPVPFGEGSGFLAVLQPRLAPEQAQKLEPFRPALRRGLHIQVWPEAQAEKMTVRLIGKGVTDDLLPPLRDVSGLRRLVLHRTGVTAAGLRQLKQV